MGFEKLSRPDGPASRSDCRSVVPGLPAGPRRCDRAGAAGTPAQGSVMKIPILTVEIRYEHDVVLSRQRARQIAELLGFDRLEQVQIATAVSEIARNTFQYAER